MIALAVGSLGVAASPALAERLAFIVGNGLYTNADKLPNPQRDATDIGARLTALGFDVTVRTDLGIGRLRSEITAFKRKVHDGDVVIIYYAGHGMEVSGHEYIIPVDADIRAQNELADQGYDITDLFFEDLKSVSLVFMFDACRDNVFVKNLRLRPAGTNPEAPPDRMILFSSASNQEALDGGAGDGQNSVFASAVLHALNLPGANETDLARHVILEVQQRTGGQQAPHVTSLLLHSVVFNGDPAPAPAVQVAAASAPPAPPPEAQQPMQVATRQPGPGDAVVRGYTAPVDVSDLLPKSPPPGALTPPPPDPAPAALAASPAPAAQLPGPLAPVGLLLSGMQATASELEATLAPIPRAAHALTGAFTIASVGYKQLPPRPLLKPVPQVNIPTSFCSVADRNKFHDQVYVPARRTAYENNDAASHYISDLDNLRREYESQTNAFYVIVVKESQDYKSVADAQFTKSEEYRKLFDTLMDRPITPCP